MSCPAGIPDGRGEDDFIQGWGDGPAMGYVRLSPGRGGIREGAKTAFQSRAIPPEDREAEAVQAFPSPPHQHPHDISFPQYRLCACASILTLVFKLAGQIYSSLPFK